MDPFGGDDFDEAFGVFDGATTTVGQKREREEEEKPEVEKRAKDESITDGLLSFGATTAMDEDAPKTKETEELEQIAMREKTARRQ